MATTTKPELTIDQARAKLSGHFAEYHASPSSTYKDGWEALWKAGDFLPWDRLIPSPALIDTLENHVDLIGTSAIISSSSDSAADSTASSPAKRHRKRALVPGCGRGVDVLLLESYGYDAVGLDYSATAVEECERFAAARGGQYVVKVEGGSRRFVQGDFYSEAWLEKLDMKPGETFDLIYDYTFFCAMQPTTRPAWAKRMSELLGPSPQANLICLEFPTTKPASTGGPPFASVASAYMEHLSHPGEEVAYDEEGNVRSNPLRPASEGGLERVGHWTPADTHPIGKAEDGSINDRIAVWRHR